MNKNWISVRDKMPPRYDYVLVCGVNDTNFLITIARWICVIIDDKKVDEWEWFYPYGPNCDANYCPCEGDSFWELYKKDITHWMPLSIFEK